MSYTWKWQMQRIVELKKAAAVSKLSNFSSCVDIFITENGVCS